MTGFIELFNFRMDWVLALSGKQSVSLTGGASGGDIFAKMKVVSA